MKPHLNIPAVARDLWLRWATSAKARLYRFTKIAETSGAFSNFGFVPALNNAGTVAFRATLRAGGEGIYTGDGQAIAKIADTSDFFRGFTSPTINDAGTVAFLASLKTGGEGIFIGDGDATTKIADTNGEFSWFNGTPALNNQGTVAFWAALEDGGEGIFTGNGRAIAAIANTNRTFSRLAAPAINHDGTVAFRATLKSGSEGIFTSKGDAILRSRSRSVCFALSVSVGENGIAKIADTTNFLRGFTSLSINNSGTLVFLAYSDAAEESLFTGYNGTLIQIANSRDLLSGFACPAINDEGIVAFWASLKTGGEGIFTTGTNLRPNKVIATGDFLLGAKVVSLVFSPTGLNNAGQIVFYASLANGTSGIFRADPTVLSSKTICEPKFLLTLPTFCTSDAVEVTTQKQLPKGLEKVK